MRPAYSGLRSGHPNPVVLGRKFCARCGRWRPVHDFDWQVSRTRAKHLRAWCRTCQRISNRASPKRWTEEQRELHREYQRIWQEVQRRRRGVPPRKWKTPLPIERVLLPVEPILEALACWEKQQEELHWGHFAHRAGVQPRQLWRLRRGESKRVRVDVADKIAVAIGVPLSIIYYDEDQR